MPDTVSSRGLSPIDTAKYAAARRAVEFVQDGMKVGLGTGSTAEWMVRLLGQKVRQEDLHILCMPTSKRTADLAQAQGLALTTLDEAQWLDLTIDGADEFDAELNLIKGGGGALLHEKIVATASDQMIVISDVSKQVDTLGAFPLPVEVIPFGMQSTRALIEETLVSMDVTGRKTTLRRNGDALFKTDEGNHIIDLHVQRIGHARQLALALNQLPGVVENGLFTDTCDLVLIGHGDGHVDAQGVHDPAAAEDMALGGENIFTDL